MDRPEFDLRAVCAQASALYAQALDEDAEQLLRQALTFRPAASELWRTLAPVLLVQGKYREGFQAFEARGERLLTPLSKLSYPEWEGAPLCGRSIMIGGEQGLGDEIQFARFVPALRGLGASRITLAVASANVRALASLDVDAVIPRDKGGVAVPKHDCWVMLGSLPHRLGVTLENLSGASYLSVDRRTPHGIGIVERGDPRHPNDANRSLPAGLLRNVLPQAELLQPHGDVFDSLQRLAGLELVITADTSWAHMAGALGVPCWVLTPCGRVDWRWMREGSTSPWYDSVRLVRQDRPGNWPGVIAQVVSDLGL